MKRKWYRGRFVKGVWIVAGHVAAVIAVLSILAVAGMYRQEIVPGGGSSYVQSRRFGADVYDSAYTVLGQLKKEAVFVDEGAGSSKVVDLQEIFEGSVLAVNDDYVYDYSGEPLSYGNTSGLAYQVEDLRKWAQESWGFIGYGSGENILVCEKPDGTCEYYYYNDFAKRISSGELRFIADGEYLEDVGESEEEVIARNLERLKQGTLESGITQVGIKAVVNGRAEQEYLDIRNYTGPAIVEKYAPADAAGILEVINTNPRWKGRIDEAYKALAEALHLMADSLDAAEGLAGYQEGNTNFTYLYADGKNKKILTNKTAYSDYAKFDSSIKSMMSDGAYVVIRPQLSDCTTNIAYLNADGASGRGQSAGLQLWQHMLEGQGISENFVFAVNVDTAFPVADDMSTARYYYDRYAKWLYPVMAAGAAALLIFLVGLVWLTVAAGRRPEDEEVHLCGFDRWFTEVGAVLVAALGLLGAAGVSENSLRWIGSWGRIIFTVAASLYFTALFFIGYLSLMRRIKAKTLWKNSLLRFFGGVFKKAGRRLGDFREVYARNTRSLIKVAVAAAGFLVLQFILLFLLFMMVKWLFLILLLAIDVALLVFLLWKAGGREKILEGLKRISGGELQYKIPLEYLRGEQKTMAEYINNIGGGLDAAVENSVKNERMKTELITNVSHDIKTPLTSIINYVGLLKRENFTDPKVCGYLDILEEKTQRLKVLTEDVLEASKASTGNITFEMAELDFVEMLHQVIGEFEEKFGEKKLAMVVHFADEPSMIYADGQHMWRVLENIFNNVVKYAMEGTRVYAEVKKDDKKVIFSLKNISAQPLNISPDELTERFIRGDLARNTEGSGLGLSIAKSLTELQGGEFNLYLDGDLFKVIITFTAR